MRIIIGALYGFGIGGSLTILVGGPTFLPLYVGAIGLAGFLSNLQSILERVDPI
jgi:hypothetical protein